jgi:hypothetical protein
MKGDHRDSADITVLGGRGLTAILEAIHSPVLAPQQKSANTALKATAGDWARWKFWLGRPTLARRG